MARKFGLKTIKRWIIWLEEAFQRRFAFFLALMVVGLILNEYSLFGWNFSEWDPLLLSGELTFIIVLRLAFTIPAKVQETINRLIYRCTLQLTPEQLKKFNLKMEASAERWADWTGVIL